MFLWVGATRPEDDIVNPCDPSSGQGTFRSDVISVANRSAEAMAFVAAHALLSGKIPGMLLVRVRFPGRHRFERVPLLRYLSHGLFSLTLR